MSIGNDILLCPLCEGERGCKECPICEGEGRTFTWKVESYWAIQRKLLKEKDNFVVLEAI